ncbi:MAG TPA: alpha/beta hydrolase-fold protein [Thermomicrobiales bacterium]
MSAITVEELRTQSAQGPSGADAERLAERIRARVGAEALANGSAQFVDELDVAWVLAAPRVRSVPLVVAAVGADFRLPMQPLGDTGLFAATATWAHGDAARWHYEVDGERLGGGQTETYLIHPDCRERPGVPKGRLLARSPWRSQVFAGTIRDWSVYLPAKTDGPAAVMVFQDGVRFYQEFVPTVFDNLIADGDMPPTVGIFLNPGVFADTTVSNRSFEYDTLSDQYVRFLLEEILPEVSREVPLREDAAGRAICGMSSGGICAFTAAWQRPDQFHKVLSHIGSFTNIASGPTLRDGGHNYPALIRKMPPKPLRVALQDGENDLDHAAGNWWLANLQMDAALRFAGYDRTFARGKGFHSLGHGRAIFPDSLRWLWRP